MVEVVAADETPSNRGRAPVELHSAVVRFAGDSGDGMQLTGNHFTMATALARNDLATFPDFPAEIRAPAGTTFGVSAFQINFGSGTVMTAGDELDVLVAMNPAALKVNLERLETFLDTLPNEYRSAFEFLVASLFISVTYKMLTTHQMAFCLYNLICQLSREKITADLVDLQLHGPAGPIPGPK